MSSRSRRVERRRLERQRTQTRDADPATRARDLAERDHIAAPYRAHLAERWVMAPGYGPQP